MKYQLVPPNVHHRNITEKAIQTFRDHFVAFLCRTDVNFPEKLWCYIFRQAEHQLNLLQKARVKPEVSSFKILYSQHRYNTNPFAPLGCAVKIYVIPGNRKTWEANTTKSGLYLENSLKHCRCHEVWIRDTRSVRVEQTIFSNINT